MGVLTDETRIENAERRQPPRVVIRRIIGRTATATRHPARPETCRQTATTPYGDLNEPRRYMPHKHSITGCSLQEVR